MSESTLWRDKTDWALRRSGPMWTFLRTESASAAVLVAAVVAALVWANIDIGSYRAVWETTLSIRLGGAGMTEDLRTWVNSGLMTLFFLVVGLEARREFDLGDLRDRRRVVLPLAAGLAGMVLPVLVFLAINAGGEGAHGWGVAMSTDTALALGALALLGRTVPGRARVFLLTVFVVDDLAALVIIATVYSEHIKLGFLIAAVVVFGLYVVTRAMGVTRGTVFAGIGVVLWAVLLASGVDPVVAGLAIGLSAPAYTPERGTLDQATGVVRSFREQPTPQLARTATAQLASTLSPNARLQHLFHPWTSYLIVPLFALANTGIVLDGDFLAHAYLQPVTLGILAGYLLGKPIAVAGTSWLVTKLSRGKLRPPVGWAAVLGSGTIAGIGFTVALLIATRAFHGELLDEAKLGALTAALAAAVLTWIVYRVTALLPARRRAVALLGNPRYIVDLVPPVDAARDHIRGRADAPVTIVEYGDFECPYCGQAEPILREMLAGHGAEVRYVWRHLPLVDVHPHAQQAVEAAEAAAAQGAFWEMHDLLLDRQEDLRDEKLVAFAAELGLDTDRFQEELAQRVHTSRIEQDLESADLSGVSGTPTFFVNGQRHHGAYDLPTLTAAVEAARVRAEHGLGE
jgi:Na+/H+ antiporter NhaA